MLKNKTELKEELMLSSKLQVKLVCISWMCKEQLFANKFPRIS